MTLLTYFQAMATNQVEPETQPAVQDPLRTLSTLAATSEPKINSLEASNIEAGNPKEDDYSHGAHLAAIVVSLMLGMFLVALDNVSCTISWKFCIADRGRYQTILGTAIPKITDEFHDLNKVSWYGAAYFMTFGGG
jgi:MFS transporter, DHA2 family, glioxin efflux transporter